jgi:hypothetical protein
LEKVSGAINGVYDCAATPPDQRCMGYPCAPPRVDARRNDIYLSQ